MPPINGGDVGPLDIVSSIILTVLLCGRKAAECCSLEKGK